APRLLGGEHLLLAHDGAASADVRHAHGPRADPFARARPLVAASPGLLLEEEEADPREDRDGGDGQQRSAHGVSRVPPSPAVYMRTPRTGQGPWRSREGKGKGRKGISFSERC